MHAFTAVKRVIDKIMEWCNIIILAIMTILVTYQVITRYFFNRPSAISEGLAQYLFVWMIMFGSAYVFGLREHLNITVIKDKLSPMPYLIVEILTNFVLLLFSWAVMILGDYQGALKQMTTVDASLQIPMGIIYIAIPICGFVMLFYAIYNICLAVVEYHQKIAAKPAPTTGKGESDT